MDYEFINSFLFESEKENSLVGKKESDDNNLKTNA